MLILNILFFKSSQVSEKQYFINKFMKTTIVFILYQKKSNNQIQMSNVEGRIYVESTETYATFDKVANKYVNFLHVIEIYYVIRSGDEQIGSEKLTVVKKVKNFERSRNLILPSQGLGARW